MSMPGTMTWFAAHEMRLAWRDVFAMLTGGKTERLRRVAIGVGIFLAVMHVVAYFAVGRLASLALANDLPTLIAVTAGVLLSGSAVLSQAMESVTRTFYTRSDLELILSSPVAADRLFAVRIGAIALTVGTMSLLFIGPFINVLAWLGGVRWLGAYGIIVAVSLTATAMAVALAVLLFQVIGPKRTRLAAQIAAAVIGGLFVIGLQVAALFSTGTLSQFAFLRSGKVLANAPDLSSLLWWPARGALGDVPAMLSVVVVSIILFVVTTALYAPRFARFFVAASSVSRGGVSRQRLRVFAVQAPAAALRRKERMLLARDPWLLSQSLMQMLYLLPPALMLWHNYGAGGGIAVVLVPVLVMSAGQLAGGLAWLTLSGEDAPDLVSTAPVPESLLLRAKIEAVMQCIAAVFLPFVAALIALSPGVALAAALGIAASAASATAIQFRFRAQAKRSQFRRRHTSSRVATLSEALSSIAWAGT
ncbi:MAG: permease, partial [Alphaproteobacteria bacterium]|nr:permease [Alphaproteobacteria bacterium]